MNGGTKSHPTPSALGSRRTQDRCGCRSGAPRCRCDLRFGETTVPNVTGTEQQAAASLQAAGLAIGKRSDIRRSPLRPVPYNNQSPAPGRVSRTRVDLSIACPDDQRARRRRQACVRSRGRPRIAAQVRWICTYSTDVAEDRISQSPENAEVTVARLSTSNLRSSRRSRLMTGLVTADAESVSKPPASR
jgi:hypothetical protein